MNGSDEAREERIAVSITISFPLIPRPVLAEHLAPVVQAVIAAGGDLRYLSIEQGPDRWSEDEEDGE
jgi:hypothetical protein